MNTTTDYTTWLQSLKTGDVLRQVYHHRGSELVAHLTVTKVTATQIKCGLTKVYDRRTGKLRGAYPGQKFSQLKMPTA